MNKKVIQNVTAHEPPLIVIVGPTASGKSDTAMQIATAYGGEIICADSRTVYRGMDIGTAKPSLDDQARVPHWGIDLVEPNEHFTAADFKTYALTAIADIRSRGRLPILVGGTGLYVDGVIFDFTFAAPNPRVRAKLEQLSLDELKHYCSYHNIELPENEHNRRYVIRAIEKQGAHGNRGNAPISNTIIVGITTEKQTLRTRIASRAEQLFENGMVEEAKMLGEKYGWNSEAMTGNIYKLVKQFLDGELSEDQLKEKFITADWKLAKRQLTWFKRNEYIHWVERDGAFEYIATQIEGPRPVTAR